MAEMAPELVDVSLGGDDAAGQEQACAHRFPELHEAATTGRPTFRHLVQARGIFQQPKKEGDDDLAAWLLPRLRQRFADVHGGIEKEFYCKHVVGGCLLASDASLHSILNSAPPELIAQEIECKIMARESGVGFASPRLRPQLEEATDHAYSALTRVLGAANLVADPTADEAAKTAALVSAAQEGAAARARVSALLQRQARYEYFQGVLAGVLPTVLLIAVLGAVADAYVSSLFSVAHAVGAVTMATLGAVVSVVQRMSSGGLVVDFTAPRGQRLALGALRPLVGAVFGAVAYFALLTGVLASGAEDADGASSFAFFALLGFAAGFSERFATDMLERAGQLIGAPTTAPEPAAPR